MLYKSSHINRAIAALGRILSAMLLVRPIAHLYLVHNPGAKLLFVAMSTLPFSSSVGLCTNARRVEVSGATAAYAAVLAVLVSGDLGGTNTEQSLDPA